MAPESPIYWQQQQRRMLVLGSPEPRGGGCPDCGGLLRPLQAAATGADWCGLPSPSGLSAQIVKSPARGSDAHDWDSGEAGLGRAMRWASDTDGSLSAGFQHYPAQARGQRLRSHIAHAQRLAQSLNPDTERGSPRLHSPRGPCTALMPTQYPPGLNRSLRGRPQISSASDQCQPSRPGTWLPSEGARPVRTWAF